VELRRAAKQSNPCFQIASKYLPPTKVRLIFFSMMTSHHGGMPKELNSMITIESNGQIN
jgi:hypothetical protein